MALDWQPTTGGYTAALRVDGICIARLHARADAWQIEHLDGMATGTAGSVGHAKRAALQKLAAVLPRFQFEVDVALRTP